MAYGKQECSSYNSLLLSIKELFFSGHGPVRRSAFDSFRDKGPDTVKITGGIPRVGVIRLVARRENGHAKRNGQ